MTGSARRSRLPSGWGSEMPPERVLIVNADDFGLSEGVNAGIVEAHEHGIVTSTSLMVRKPAAEKAAALAHGLPSLAVGLHIDIGQWDYEEGEWRVAYERCSAGDRAAVWEECRGQLAAFRDLMGRDPTHLDSHQHTHMSEQLASVAMMMATDLGLPLRARGIRYEGGFYGQTGKGEPFAAGITVERLVELIGGLPGGLTELGCHPGIGVKSESSYGPEREEELAVLCDRRVRAAIAQEGIELRSFSEVL
jgi:predicted glycoside hydrolase/deacetylase ChbG (UPF0249 family)